MGRTTAGRVGRVHGARLPRRDGRHIGFSFPSILPIKHDRLTLVAEPSQTAINGICWLASMVAHADGSKLQRPHSCGSRNSSGTEHGLHRHSGKRPSTGGKKAFNPGL
jgi:hypothetical protein